MGGSLTVEVNTGILKEWQTTGFYGGVTDSTALVDIFVSGTDRFNPQPLYVARGLRPKTAETIVELHDKFLREAETLIGRDDREFLNV